MAYQTNSNGYVAYKVQSGLGSPASGSGGTVLRQTGGSGGRLSKAATASNEVRRDGMRIRGRHGTQKTAGEWTAELGIGSHETIMQAIVRDTWDASALTITQATMTSVVTGANTITAGGGDWRTQGLRVFDVIQLTGFPDVANNSRNLRITGLTATVITVAETLTVNATPDTTFSVVRPKKLIQFAGGVLLPRYYTIDEYDIDIDRSETMSDFVWGALKFTMAPDGIITADPGGIGTGQFGTLNGAASPLLTSPTESSAVPLAVVDATIRTGGVDLVSLTGLDIMMDIGPTAPSTFGSGAIKYSPDVFAGQMAVSMNLSMLRQDTQFMTDFAAETPYSLHVLAVENESEPKDFVSIVIPSFTLGGVAKSPLSKQGGARTQTISVPADLVGKDTTGTGYDATMIKFQSTGA